MSAISGLAKSPTALAIFAAIAFAMQHPFTKIGAGTDYSFVFLAVWTNLFATIVGGVFLVIFSRIGTADLVSFLKIHKNRKGVLIYAMIGVMSSLIYMWTISFTSVVLFSLILNSSPIWGGIWGRIISGRQLPNYFTVTILCYFLAIFGGTILFNRGFYLWEFNYWSLLAFIIPCLFVFRTSYMNKYFWGDDELGKMSANIGTLFGAFCSSFIIFIMWTISVLFGTETIPNNININIVWVTIGSISALVGMHLYTRANDVSGNNTAYVTTYNMLIPTFVILISLFISYFYPNNAIGFENYELYIAVIILVLMVFFTIKNKNLIFYRRQ